MKEDIRVKVGYLENTFTAIVEYVPCDVGDLFRLKREDTGEVVWINPVCSAFVGFVLIEDKDDNN